MINEKKRRYTHIQTFEKEIAELQAEGKTQREIADYYGFKDKYVVKGFLKRQRRKQRCIKGYSGKFSVN